MRELGSPFSYSPVAILGLMLQERAVVFLFHHGKNRLPIWLPHKKTGQNDEPSDGMGMTQLWDGNAELCSDPQSLRSTQPFGHSLDRLG